MFPRVQCGRAGLSLYRAQKKKKRKEGKMAPIMCCFVTFVIVSGDRSENNVGESN